MTYKRRLSPTDRDALDALVTADARRPWTLEDIHRVKHCWYIGASVGWIALEMDRFQGDVSAKLRAAGVLNNAKHRRRILFATDHPKFTNRRRKQSGVRERSSQGGADAPGDQTRKGDHHGK